MLSWILPLASATLKDGLREHAVAVAPDGSMEISKAKSPTSPETDLRHTQEHKPRAVAAQKHKEAQPSSFAQVKAKEWGLPIPPNPTGGGQSDFDAMMTELDHKLDTAPRQHSSFSEGLLGDIGSGLSSLTSLGGSSTAQAGQLGTDVLLNDLREAQNRSGLLAEELLQLHKEAAQAETDLPRAAHLEDRLQDLVAAEREEAQRNERLAVNLAGWLSATKTMMSEQTARLDAFTTELSTAAIASVLLLFLLTVFVISKAATKEEK